MNPVVLVAILIATGLIAGIVSAVVGNATTVAFPVLVVTGFSPLVANMTVALGLLSGSVSSTWRMRNYLDGQGQRVIRLAVPAAVGSLLGAILVLVLPPVAFAAATPTLLGVAFVLVVIQPLVKWWIAVRRQPVPDQPSDDRPPLVRALARAGVPIGAHSPATDIVGGLGTGTGTDHDDIHDDDPGDGHVPADGGCGAAREHGAVGWGWMTVLGVIGIYCGFFGAGTGVIIYAVLGVALHQSMQRSNAAKLVLVLACNGVASGVFVVASLCNGHHVHIAWLACVALAAGSWIGGEIGARISRSLPEPGLRGLLIGVAGLAFLYELARQFHWLSLGPTA